LTTPVINNVFQDSIEHVYAEMRVINLYIKKLVLAARTRDALWERKDLRGLYISDKEVSYLLGTELYPWSIDLFETSSEAAAIKNEIDVLRGEIDRKTSASLATGVSLRLSSLITAFGLTDFEKMVLLLALLPEVAPHSERLFGYIQDDVTRRRPTVALALDAFCSPNAAKLDRRAAFLPGSTLISRKLVRLYDDNSRKGSPVTGLSIKVDDRITDYLLGLDTLDAALLPWVSLYNPDATAAEFNIEGSVLAKLEGCLDSMQNSAVLIYSGLAGVNEAALTAAVSNTLKCPVLAADFGRMLEVEPDPLGPARMLCREATLTGAAIFCRRFDAVIASRQATAIISELEGFTGNLLVSGDSYNSLALHWNKRVPIPFQFSAPKYDERAAIWRRESGAGLPITDALINALSGKFQLNNNQIEKALRIARGISWQQNSGEVSSDALFQSCRMISATRLMEVAHKVTPRYMLPDIVLPPEPYGQLQDILDYVTYRHIVLDNWGFRQKSSLGKGLNILFSGASGTGKTMAAEIIAGEMGLDLYKIDLSIVVSKYIGETEKNLDRVFKEATDSNCVLFFDEADALFGKRSEVRDAHDRYANIEIAYLLQKMEEYEGIVILATNLKKNVDEAFARRMHFSIEFPAPEQEYRLLIWQKSFPAEAPVSPDLDMDFMSRQFRLTGGNIKNIALTAAFMAVKNGGVISMKDLILATRREFQKTGKLSTEAEFGKYFSVGKQQGKNGEI
jgi:hypothetical protein